MAVLTVSGTEFRLDGKPFDFVGMSFFNALYNRAFNASEDARGRWLDQFRRYGVEVLRIWGQWDNRLGLIDTGPEETLYTTDGALRAGAVERLKALAAAADARGMVIEVALFTRETWDSGLYLSPEALDAGAANLARAMQAFRNVVFQVWNENSVRVLEVAKAIKAVDTERLVTNSPGWDGRLGDVEQNTAMDFLTPHTTRQRAGNPLLIAPKEVAYLLERYRKPVVDDEPARTGTAEFGGPLTPASPYDHILQMWEMWKLGAGTIYHHDMFQTAYGTPTIPPHGVPDPEFSAYHRQVFEFMAIRSRYVRRGMACPSWNAT